jgi:hypothetical protein
LNLANEDLGLPDISRDNETTLPGVSYGDFVVVNKTYHVNPSAFLSNNAVVHEFVVHEF